MVRPMRMMQERQKSSLKKSGKATTSGKQRDHQAQQEARQTCIPSAFTRGGNPSRIALLRKKDPPSAYPRILGPALAGLFLASRPDETGSPRCATKALDQKIYEDLHLGRLMTARRQQSVQRVDLRILCVLQQEL
jgi:hypothetical protein